MKEQKLAERLVKGDTRALERIIDTYSGYVRTVARNCSRGMLSGEDIDEITADVFYKLWSCRENIVPGTGLRPYLSAAARNAVKNRFRSLDPPAEDIDGLDIPSGFLVERKAEISEMMKLMSEDIDRLPADDREIFLRFYLYGERSSQIAKAMDMPENTVCTKLRRTREKLRRGMLERGFDYV